MPGACFPYFSERSIATGSIWGHWYEYIRESVCLGVDCRGMEFLPWTQAAAVQRNGWFVGEEAGMIVPDGDGGDLPVWGACCMELPAHSASGPFEPSIGCLNAVQENPCVRGWYVVLVNYATSLVDPDSFPDYPFLPCRIRRNFFEWWEADWTGHVADMEYAVHNTPHDVRPTKHHGDHMACRCTTSVPPFVAPDWAAAGITDCLRPVNNDDPWGDFCDLPFRDEFDIVCDVGMPVVLDTEGRAAFYGGERRFDKESRVCQHLLADPRLREDGSVDIVACMDREEGEFVSASLGQVSHDECAASYADLEFQVGFDC